MTYYTATDAKFVKLTATTLRQAKTQATKAQVWGNEDAAVYVCKENGIAKIIAIKHSTRNNNARWEKESNWIGQTEDNPFFKA